MRTARGKVHPTLKYFARGHILDMLVVEHPAATPIAVLWDRLGARLPEALEAIWRLALSSPSPSFSWRKVKGH